MATRIQLRGDTAVNWSSANPTLALREIGIETDSRRLKIGDGATAWNSLAYFNAASIPYGTGSVASTFDTLIADLDAAILRIDDLEAWVDAAAYVGLTGDQTIDGIKTFSVSPVIPTPDTAYEAATKEYVDGQVTQLDSEKVDSVGGLIAGYKETYDRRGTVSGTVTLDFAVANVWRIDPSGPITIVFANVPTNANEIASGTLIVGNSNYAITWPTGTGHPENTAPEISGLTFLSIVATSTGVTVGSVWIGVA